MPVATILKTPYLIKAAIIAAVATIVTVGFLTIRVIVNHEGLDPTQSSITSSIVVDTEKMEAQYLVGVQEILSDYANTVTIDSPDLSVLTTSARDRLLSLTVPTRYRDSHLALVLDFDALNIAIRENNSASIERVFLAIIARSKAN
jgi:hypothetical protein